MEIIERNILYYETRDGKIPFREWVYDLPSEKTQEIIHNRISRLRSGNFGDCKTVGGGIFELRIHYGPGYRIYFGEIENTIVLLLLGGEKDTQIRDIMKAQSFWEDFRR
ncbi:MAG: addiction module protein [Elusimicrobia bacterium RIFCSPLOWO2_01_FULL_60_11]|nr:MAG: addiction module protein [Elusimicrobia bacterium RIFCSPLOWO2_01_FULL_60_11]